MNPIAFFPRHGCCFIFASLFLLGLTFSASAQNGGTINPGHGLVGQQFALYPLTVTIVGNVPGSPTPNEALAGWKVEGAAGFCRSGDKLFLPPGKYTVKFKPQIKGWVRPPDHQDVKVPMTKPEIGTYKKAADGKQVMPLEGQH